MKSDVSIAQNAGNYKIKVSGRASFECSPALRNLAKSLENEKFKSMCIDLTSCESMDSTFMGVLAMLGLRAMKQNVSIEIANASDFSKKLLDDLGVSRLFKFTETETAPDEEFESTVNDNIQEKNETVLEAHKTLMEIDDDNVEKFEKVVEFVKKDLGK